MKFLFKTTLLVLVCMSNFIFGLTTSSNPLLEQANKMVQQTQQNISQQDQPTEQEIKQVKKVTIHIAKILNSPDCNCKNINLLSDEELAFAFRIIIESGYTTPRDEKGVQEEIADALEFSGPFETFGHHSNEDKKLFLEEFIRIKNEQMKCFQKMLRTIKNLKSKVDVDEAE